MFDDRNMVNEFMCKAIKSRLKSTRKLDETYMKFMIEEPNCRDDVSSLLDTYARIIMHNGFGFEDDEEFDLDAALSVSQQFGEISAIIRFTFAVGIMYGSARFEQDFDRYFGELDEEEKYESGR